jgi:hypothetical protein
MKRPWLMLLCMCALTATAQAHVLDQYLQVAQIALAPDGVRVELRLIPGVEAAHCVFVLMDADHDGRLSAAEEQAYARRVWQDLALAINQKAVPLALAGAQFPERAAMSEGLGTIRLVFEAKAALQAAEQLDFQNRHLPALSVYLVNALVPESAAIKITGQQRDALQRGLQLQFHAMKAEARVDWRWLAVLLGGLGLVALLWLRKNKIATLLARRLSWVVGFRHSAGLRLARQGGFQRLFRE